MRVPWTAIRNTVFKLLAPPHSVRMQGNCRKESVRRGKSSLRCQECFQSQYMLCQSIHPANERVNISQSSAKSIAPISFMTRAFGDIMDISGDLYAKRLLPIE